MAAAPCCDRLLYCTERCVVVRSTSATLPRTSTFDRPLSVAPATAVPPEPAAASPPAEGFGVESPQASAVSAPARAAPPRRILAFMGGSVARSHSPAGDVGGQAGPSGRVEGDEADADLGAAVA